MDTGLLQGLAEGLKSGLQSYREEQDRQYKRDLEQKKYLKDQQEQEERLGLLKEQREIQKMQLGLKRDQEGKWIPDPESLAYKKLAIEEGKQDALMRATLSKEQQSEYDRILNEKKLEQEREKIGMTAAEKGLIKGESGYQLSPEAQAKQAAELQAKQAQAGLIGAQAETEKAKPGLMAAQTEKAKAEAKKSLTPKGAGESFKSLPKDKQITIENLSKEKARLTGINSQVEQLKNQILDPKISEADKLATAREQLKLLNSTLGSDAVGAEEVKRLASYLQYAPDPFGPKGMKVGPDLQGYARQLDRINQRSSGTMQTLQNNIDIAYGRKSQTGLLTEKQTVPQSDTKVWNGVTYKRVGNQWVAQ